MSLVGGRDWGWVVGGGSRSESLQKMYEISDSPFIISQFFANLSKCTSFGVILPSGNGRLFYFTYYDYVNVLYVNFIFVFVLIVVFGDHSIVTSSWLSLWSP